MMSPTAITDDHFQLDVNAALKAGLIVRANENLQEQARYRAAFIARAAACTCQSETKDMFDHYGDTGLWGVPLPESDIEAFQKTAAWTLDTQA